MPLSEILKCLKKFDFFYCRTKIAVAKKYISTKKYDILIFGGIPVGSLPSKIRPAVVMQNDLLGIKDLFSNKKK